jgi:hydroxymethylpyrimidine pyrophosphatase-like HAD family hydrolase
MKFKTFICDYDGTLATNGKVEKKVVRALERLLQAGWTLILASGRVLPDLLSIFPEIALFDRVLVEDGALVYWPLSGKHTLLAPAPPRAFLDCLYAKDVKPLSIGHVVVATWRPHEMAVLETIQEMNLNLTISFNKSAVMVLPAGVNKATGLQTILKEMGISLKDCVGVGDAENDYLFLKECGYSAAVANAIEPVKKSVNWIASAANGDGVCELIRHLLMTPAAVSGHRELL